MATPTIYVDPAAANDSSTFTQAQVITTPAKTLKTASGYAYGSGDVVSVVMTPPASRTADHMLQAANPITFSVAPSVIGTPILLQDDGANGYLFYTNKASTVSLSYIDYSIAIPLDNGGVAVGVAGASLSMDHCTIACLSTNGLLSFAFGLNVSLTKSNITINGRVVRALKYDNSATVTVADNVMSLGASSTGEPTFYLASGVVNIVRNAITFGTRANELVHNESSNCLSFTLADNVIVGTVDLQAFYVVNYTDTSVGTVVKIRGNRINVSTSTNCAIVFGSQVTTSARATVFAGLSHAWSSIEIAGNSITNRNPAEPCLWVSVGANGAWVHHNRMQSGAITDSSAHTLQIAANNCTIDNNLSLGQLSYFLSGDNNTLIGNTGYGPLSACLVGKPGGSSWESPVGGVIKGNLLIATLAGTGNYALYTDYLGATSPKADYNVYVHTGGTAACKISGVECSTVAANRTQWTSIGGACANNDLHSYIVTQMPVDSQWLPLKGSVCDGRGDPTAFTALGGVDYLGRYRRLSAGRICIGACERQDTHPQSIFENLLEPLVQTPGEAA